MPQLTLHTRSRIQDLHDQGYSERAIARKMHCSRDTISRWTQMRPLTSRSLSTPGRGAKRKLTPKQEKTVKRIAEEKKYVGSRHLVRKVEEATGVSLHFTTLSRYISSFNFTWGSPRPGPALSPSHMEKRLLWAIQHRSFDWKDWIFSDEKLFRGFQAPVGRRYIRGERPRKGKKNHPPKFHVWWAIHYTQDFPAVECVGKVDARTYISVLSRGLVPRYNREMMFMQDGAPAHTSYKTRHFLLLKGVRYCKDWPAMSPDLNPMENLWAIVNYQVRLRDPQTYDELVSVVREEIGKVSRDQITTLIDSVKSRMNAVIEAQGGWTKY
jgi:transposase